jgi:hypothetical protein
LENIFLLLLVQALLSLQRLPEIKSQSFRKNHKSIFTFLCF